MRVTRISPEIRRYDLLILASGCDGPVPHSKSIVDCEILSHRSSNLTPQSSSLDEVSGLARVAHLDLCRDLTSARRRPTFKGENGPMAVIEHGTLPYLIAFF